MTSPISLTPELHQVYNSFDDHGILLGLDRIHGERNAVYKQRLMDVFVNRAGAAYRGLINGITRELGLEFYAAIEVSCLTDSNGDFLLENPAVVFDGNLCTLVSNADPDNYETYLEIDRCDHREAEWYLGGLVDAINATPYFSASLASGADPWSRSAAIYNQSTIGRVSNEGLAKGTLKVKLDSEDLIPGTINISSPNLRERVTSEIQLTRAGRYYIDHEAGIIHCTEAPAQGSVVRYVFRTNPMTVWASPVIINSLQFDPFRKKLFERVYDDLGNDYDGHPSSLGLDVINELYSVAAVYWGP